MKLKSSGFRISSYLSCSSIWMKSIIRTSEIPELYQVANYMLRFPEIKMKSKDTDVRASENYNMGLSEEEQMQWLTTL